MIENRFSLRSCSFYKLSWQDTKDAFSRPFQVPLQDFRLSLLHVPNTITDNISTNFVNIFEASIESMIFLFLKKNPHIHKHVQQQ